MIVVSDTTPLISLMKIGHLDLIYHLFWEIQIAMQMGLQLIGTVGIIWG